MTNFSYIVKDESLFGTDLLRADSELPPAFRPTVAHTVRQSANKRNNNHTVECLVPVVNLLEGRQVASDIVKATLKLSALQDIVTDTEMDLALDAVVAYVTAHRAILKQGLKPHTATTLVVTATP